MNTAVFALSGIAPFVCLVAPAFADINSPVNYPKEYKLFVQALKDQVKKNPYDFSTAANHVFKATNDELSMQAWMDQAAKEGVPAALYYVANQRRLVLFMSTPGKDTQKEAIAINKLYEQAAAAGFTPALIHMAGNLVDGIGVKKDEAKAIKLLAQASRTGDNHARLRWLQLTRRLRSDADFERKEVQFEVKRGNDAIIYELARLSRENKKSLEYLRKAAELGNGKAYAELSRLLSRTNPKDSFALAIKGAQLFDPECMATVGYCMLDPEFKTMSSGDVTIPHDPAKGLYLLKLAAMLHSPYGHMQMGRIYHNGLFGVAKDQKRAFEHYKQSTLRQDPLAHVAYSYYLLKGLGTEANPKEAQRHLLYLARQNNSPAIALIAYSHYKGLGVKQDVAKAQQALEELALTYPLAYIYLADMKGKEKDPQKVDQSIVDHYLRLASLAMPEQEAKKFYDEIQKAGDWIFDF